MLKTASSTSPQQLRRVKVQRGHFFYPGKSLQAVALGLSHDHSGPSEEECENQ